MRQPTGRRDARWFFSARERRGSFRSRSNQATCGPTNSRGTPAPLQVQWRLRSLHSSADRSLQRMESRRILRTGSCCRPAQQAGLQRQDGVRSGGVVPDQEDVAETRLARSGLKGMTESQSRTLTSHYYAKFAFDDHAIGIVRRALAAKRSSASPPSRAIKQPAVRRLPPRDAWRRPELLRSRSDRSVPRDRVPERRTPLPS